MEWFFSDNFLKFGNNEISNVFNCKFSNQLSDFLATLHMNTKHNSVVLVRKRTIPTEPPQPAGEVSVNLTDRECGVVSATDLHGRNLGFLDPEPLLFHSSSSTIILTRLSGPRSRPNTSQNIL
jgi:hypothetical protein